MSSIIHAVSHALTGHGDNSEKRGNVHTVVCEDVHVRSIVSSETQSKGSTGHSQNKIHELMAKLGSTHAQIDEYSRRRNDEISGAVKTSIEKIVQETQIQQQQLLDDAQKQSNEVEKNYKEKLMLFVSQLDEDKATTLVQLEKDLNLRQEQILEAARKRIDALNEEANRLKMNVLKEAQAQANSKIEQITDKVAQLGAEDASRRLASTTTTVITTKAHAENHLRTYLIVEFHFVHLFEETKCASIDLIRYHANVYRCGEIILDEDLIRPLYSYFVAMKAEEHRNTNDLSPILYSLGRIENACRTAYLTSDEEMKTPSILYNGFKWLKSTFPS